VAAEDDVTYEELIAYCTRAVGVLSSERTLTLLDLLGVLQMTSQANRAINAEVLARLMSEFIEQDRLKKVIH
jgi:hypothetical protein